jgi:hypothetical protein
MEDDSSAFTDVLLDNNIYLTCNSDYTYYINESGSDWGEENGEVLHEYSIEALRF